MTRKHFEALALAMREARAVARSQTELNGVDIAIRALTDVCADFNGQFDRDRFERACGLEGNMELFDKMGCPTFDGMLPSEAWDACNEWEAWVYDNADSFSGGKWDELVDMTVDNRNRYYAKYGE